MSDIQMNDMGMEEQALLGQMVTEALLRDSQAAPDASSEWQKLNSLLPSSLKYSFFATNNTWHGLTVLTLQIIKQTDVAVHQCILSDKHFIVNVVRV